MKFKNVQRVVILALTIMLLLFDLKPSAFILGASAMKNKPFRELAVAGLFFAKLKTVLASHSCGT